MSKTNDEQLGFFESEQAQAEDVQEEVVQEVKEEGLIRGEWTRDEWESPIVENGPTRQEVEEWKDKHGKGSVFFTPFDGDVYIWRTLTRPEYREIIRNQDMTMLDREEVITEKCVLFPRDFTMEKMKKGKAGVPSLLSEMIMDKSGFVAQSAPIKL